VVKYVDLQKDPITQKFTGSVNVIFDTPNEAKRALHGMMGLNVDKSVLLTKKPQGILLIGPEGENTRDDEVF
jgi:hypothetical protein